MTRSYLGYVSSQTTDTVYVGVSVNSITADFLLVAGGGTGYSGQANRGGGGGAGGMFTGTVVLPLGTLTVTVGGATSNSVLSGTGISQTAIAGGNGGASDGAAGSSGGSGGGGNQTAAGGAGTTGQGNNGAAGDGTGGGGGGKGSAGVVGGAGGSGATNDYDGTSTTYAAGGAGADGSAVSGAANTGNGGKEATGGSGISILRWLTADANGLSFAITGSGNTLGTSGLYSFAKFVATGTLVVSI